MTGVFKKFGIAKKALTHAKVVLVDLIYFTEANLKVMMDPKMLVQK